MRHVLILLLGWHILICRAEAQHYVDDFFRVPVQRDELPVRVRGHLDQRIILLFIQGGPGETALDFARIDYPGWKGSLEKEVAIAYFDQRGLNRKRKQIDSTRITYAQYGRDIHDLARYLQEKYQSAIYLLGHSAGGHMAYRCLADIPNAEAIRGAVIANTPLTTDLSPLRYTYYRPLYLKNLAREKVARGRDTAYWGEALRWMQRTDSIHSIESSRQWNAYVDAAFQPARRKVKIGETLKVLFGKPYNPFRYLYRKDNKWVADLLWADSGTGYTQVLPHIRKPTLLITGRYDDIAPPEEIRAAHALLPDGHYIVLDDAGHESFLDRPKAFAETVLEFVLHAYSSDDSESSDE